MSEAVTIKADPREVIGHANRKLSPAGLIPAIIYGAGRDPLAVEVDRHTFEQYLTKHGASGVVQLEVGEKKPVNVVIKDMQHAAVKGNVVHIDFLAVRMDVAIAAVAPVHLVNDPVGVKEGGVLTVALHDVNIEALPADLPDAIEADVSALAIGDSLHVGELTPPEGVTLLDDPETVICSVIPPMAEEPTEEEAAEEMLEPELIGEEAEEGEAADEGGTEEE